MLWRKAICALGLVLICFADAMAQKSADYFVYIQSESKQLFYVKHNDDLQSSSPGGYIIIPKLKNGKNKLIVGFPKNQYPEQQFDIALSSNKDKGYMLKKSGDDKFSLINLTTFDQIASTTSSAAEMPAVPAPADTAVKVAKHEKKPKQPSQKPPAEEKDTAASGEMSFSQMLNRAVNGNAAQTQEDNAATDNSQTDTAAVAVADNPPPVDEQPAKTETGDQINLSADSGVERTPVALMPPPEKKEDQLDFVDSTYNPQKDIIAANNAPVTHDSAAQPQAANTNASDQNIALNNDNNDSSAKKATGLFVTHRAKRKKHSDDLQFITFLPADSVRAASSAGQATQPDQNDVFTPEKKKHHRQQEDESPAKVIPAYEDTAANNSGRLKMINSDCNGLIAEKDYQKIRRKISREDDDKSMYDEAEKYIGDQCYSVVMIENIVYLFDTDKYRYKYLELVYPHTYDSDHFSALAKVFTEAYYLNRFKAMVK